MISRSLVVTAVLAVGFGVAAPPALAGEDQGAPAYYDSGLAPTPYMGWNTYYAVGAPTEGEVRDVADHLVESGLRDAGYDIVWLDGGWQADEPRGADGRLVAHPERFPSGIPALVDYLHDRGLRAGIYTDAGVYDGGQTCGLGSGGHYDEDARQFAEWNVDAIKVDFLCGIGAGAEPEPAFREFSAAVARTGHPMLLNLCNPLTEEWGIPHTPERNAHTTYTWGPTTGDSWRTSTDIAFGTPSAGQWENVLRNMDRNGWHPEAQGPGRYNDPDYLIPMRQLDDGAYELTEEESTTQFVMWAEMASPLILGADPRTLPDSMIDTLTNPEILAVNQDPLAIQGVRVAENGTGDVYSKVLTGEGRRAVVLLNRSAQPAPMTVEFADAGLTGEVEVRDLRAREDRGAATGSFTATVPAHGTALLSLEGDDSVPGAALPGSSLGGSASASPAVTFTADGRPTVFARDRHGALRQFTDGRWHRLGGPTGGEILGQPAAYSSPGGRIDLFVRGTDAAAYRRTFEDGRWGRWHGLGGTLTDAPTVAFEGPESWTLFARDAEGQVVSRGPRGDWRSVGAPGDRPIYGRPSAVVDAEGRVHVAVRTAADAVWTRVRDASGTWGAWTDLGGTVSGSPTLLATADGRILLLVRAGDYTLWQREHGGADTGADGWGGWSRHDAFASNAFNGAPGLAQGPDGARWFAVTGVDGLVHHGAL
ncbi:glycoside hydrolase family 27 protein [Streptomyces sp. SBT349]|uniref:glycoside hydrolase family 27 protein n=1 Tax=Streptomyces sp. SBT349 TaxID=1580539 RepID=UPI000AF93842|nr:glycoside hydrolase family 27 protein [Streptomyces sp. SBT349]